MVSVLFIDDDKVTLKMVRSILESAGYSVITTTDARDGLDRLEREPVDMIITDANIPGGISGFELVRTVRKHPKFANLPIAILTGRREKKDIEKGLECGANDYIIKPIDPHILLGKIDSLLTKRTAETRTARFSEGPVRQLAQWQMNLEITYVSERGLTLVTPLPIPVDTKLKLTSSFYEQVGISSPVLRVIGFTKDGAIDNRYFVSATFIGLNDTDLQKIR
jgi:DNA-binding response OmpR family regulator